MALDQPSGQVALASPTRQTVLLPPTVGQTPPAHWTSLGISQSTCRWSGAPRTAPPLGRHAPWAFSLKLQELKTLVAHPPSKVTVAACMQTESLKQVGSWEQVASSAP